MFILGGGSHACYVIPVDLEQLSTVIKLGCVCVCVCVHFTVSFLAYILNVACLKLDYVKVSHYMKISPKL